MARPVPLDLLPETLRPVSVGRPVPLDMLPDDLRPTPEPKPEEPQEELGFFGALKRGFTTLGDVPEALGFATGQEGAREELVKAQEGEEKRAEGFGLDKTLGENAQALKELAGESLGFMAAPLAAGAAGSLAGGPIGGGIAAAATLLSQYGVQNLARQAQEDEARIARGEAPLGAMPGRAAAAAVGQAGLDVAGFALPVLRPVAAAFPFLRPLIGVGGKKAAAETAKAIVEAAAKKQLTIKGGIARGIVEGVAFEIPQETAQTVLERWQAKLPLDDDSAIEEYKQAAIGAAVLGGGFGAVGGGVNAAREQADTTKEAKAREIAAGLELSTPEEKAEFERLLSVAVNEYANANRSTAPADIFKALRDDGTIRSLGNRAKANVEAAQTQTQTQAETGAGSDGGAGRPDVDVDGAAGAGVPPAGDAATAGGDTQTVPQAEPVGVAGVGEPTGSAVGAETGADSALTPPTGAPSYVVDNARATVDALRQRNPAVLDTITDLHAQDKTAAEIAAATKLDVDTIRDVRIGLGLPSQGKPSGGKTIYIPGDAEERAAFEAWRDNYNSGKMAATVSTPETQAAEERYPALEPAYAADTSVKKQRVIAPVVANIFSQTTGLEGFNSPKIKTLPENVQKAYNTTVTAVLNGVKRGEIINPETIAQQKMAEYGVTLPEAAASEAAPEAAPAETVAPKAATPSAPTYTYADLVTEADSLVASNPELVLPGQLTAQQFQKFSMQAEQMPALAEQGVEVPTAIELRQDLYKMAGREAPPLAAPATPEPAAAEEYDADAIAAATVQAPSVWATLSKQVKGKPPAAWDTLEEEAQDEFIAAVAAIPGGLTLREFANTVRPIFNAIRTSKPAPQAAPAPEATSTSNVQPGGLMGGVRMDIDKYRGGTLSDLLEEIFANFDDKFSQYDMYLAGRISTLLSEVERAGLKVKLNILREGETAPRNVARGTAYGSVSTDLTNNTIGVYLRSPTMGEDSAGNTSEIVLHEALHAVSSAFVLARRLGRNTPKIDAFVNELNDLRNKVVDHFNQRVRSGAELNEVEKSWYKRDSNVFADIDEFLAWGMTNANAQEYLRGIEVGPGQNLFQRFVAMFKSMLGIPDGDTSALSRLIEIVNPLFEATEADYKAVMGTPAAGTAEARAKVKKPPQPQKPRVIKINQAKLKWAMREAGLLQRRDDVFRKKLLRSKTTNQLSDSVGEMFFGSRAYQGPMNLLRALRDSLTPQAKKAMLPFLPTDDITRWVGDRLKNVAVVNKLIDDMTVYRNKRLEKTSVIQNKWMKFMTAFPKGSDILNVLTKLADYHDVDPTLAATADEYAKIDPEMKRLIKEKASKAKRDNRLGAIDEVYAAKRELMRRENGSGAGLEIFKLAKDAYRRNLIDSYILTLNRITEAGLNIETQKLAISRIKFMYKEALARRVYFPTMRYGRFWMSVGNGKNVEYYMFESALERDMAFAQRKRDMAKENDLRDMKKGNDYKEVTDYLTKGNDASAALKDVFEKLDSGNLENTAELKDTVFQMYLLALPEGDMRKRFSHRRYVTGFGMDALRDFSNSQSRAASQLARLSYAHQVRAELATLEENAKEFVGLEPFVREISERAKAEIDPPIRGGFYGLLDKFAGLGNKFVFLWMLTSPKSALIQTTQLHTVGLPVLSDEFGFRKVMDIAGRYSMDIILGNKLAIHRKDNNGDIISEFNINMRDAKFMQDLAKSDPQKHKLLLEAYDYADQRGTFASTFINDLNETASRPTKVGTVKSALKEGDVLSAAKQGGDAMMQFMSAGFHQMENMNRQIMYMTSFELAYEQAKKSGMSDTAAKEKAMERALKVTRETMFNYSNYNKPRAFKNPAGRVAFQFMTYPVMMTSYLVRNAKNMLPLIGNPEGKLSAAKRLFGTLGMTAMYAGMTGLPLYGAIMMAAEAAREMWRDDDDFAPYEDDKGNPVGKVDLRFWFENSWLPETFGPDSSVAKTLGLPPELAVLLERGIKFGPISALSDMNLASSTSLNDLFFRGDIKADNLEGQFKEILYNQMMGPLGGLISNMTRGVQLYEEGQTTRAMELMLPAFVKGAVRASRLSDEGLKTIDGKVLKDADFYTEGKLFSQVLGFGSTETYEMQKQNFEGKQIVDEIKAEREDMFQKAKSAELRATENPTEANLRAMVRANNEMDKFNNRYPFSPIEGQSLDEAVTNALEERAGSIGGAELDAEYPVMDDVLARRLQGK